MPLQFKLDLPPDYLKPPIIISGPEIFCHSNKIYLWHIENEEIIDVFEIRYEYHTFPFKQAQLINNILAVGHEEHFYLFDTLQEKHLLTIQMKGYFGHLYVDRNTFYVTDAYGLYCINEKGESLWNNSNLGIDGVIIEEIDNTQISGLGEWDPPDGWVRFVVDKQTGRLLQN